MAQTPKKTKQASVKSAHPVASDSLSLAGRFEGTLHTGAIDLLIVLHVTKTPTGWEASLDSPDQGAFGIPIKTVTVANRKTHLEVPSIRGTFEGELSSDGNTLTGFWSQGSPLALTLVRKEKADVVKRPQTPKPPFPYKTEDVSYANPKAAGVTLAATLNLPAGEGPFPCVVFITGSGPQDRDETLFNHKPFAVIADYLARNGIASLRADDRGVAKSTGNFAAATSLDFKTDTEAGIAFLKTRKEIDPKRVGLIGHSEGGLIAPMVAVEMPSDVAAIVLLAGPAVRGEEIMLEQNKLILKSMGAPDAMVALGSRNLRGIFSILNSEKDDAKAQAEIISAASAQLAQQPGVTPEVLERQKPALALQAKMYSSAWFRFFLSFDPADTLKQVKCPVLALNGSKDLQVPPYQNLPVFEKIFNQSGNTELTTKEMPGLNHLFQTAQTGAIQEYGKLEETFQPAALVILGDWLRQKFGITTK